MDDPLQAHNCLPCFHPKHGGGGVLQHLDDHLVRTRPKCRQSLADCLFYAVAAGFNDVF
jgi:hypothetical protein